VIPTVIGRFDPSAITGFSGLSRVPLESYRAPEVTAADDATRAALGGEPLRPDRNLGGYLRQPPALLTTLESIDVFTSTRRDAGIQADAPISSIRIRVAGVVGVDELSRARVNDVVNAIYERLGEAVEVEITVGASPAPQQVALPAGLAGDQRLLVEEYWAQKGVGIRIVDAVNLKSAALFGLVLVVCGLYLAHGALASVRARRSELATLLALGWSRSHAFGVVAAELMLVGVAGGAIGAALAWAASRALDIPVSPGQTALTVPLAAGVALLAGVIPAYRASRIPPIEAFRAPVTPARRTRPVRSLGRLAVTNVLRSRGRTALGVAGLGLAVAALTVLLAITMAFRGQVTGSLLGAVVIADVRTVDYLAVGLSLVLGAVALVDVVVMNQKGRAGEYATLAATGWSGRELVTVATYEGLVMAATGGLAGAVVGLAVAAALAGSLLTAGAVVTMVVAALAAAVGGLGVVLVALLAPARRFARLAPAVVLAEE
jgi:putative ABC transport system permease protein